MMTSDLRKEIVNLARSYERAWAHRRSFFVQACKLMAEGRKDEAKNPKAQFMNLKTDVARVEAMLAERIYHECDCVRVDEVIYIAYSPQTVLRIPLASIPDIANSPDLAAESVS